MFSSAMVSSRRVRMRDSPEKPPRRDTKGHEGAEPFLRVVATNPRACMRDSVPPLSLGVLLIVFVYFLHLALHVPQAIAAPSPVSGGMLKCAVFEKFDDAPFPAPSGFHSRALASASYEGLTRLDADGQVMAGIASNWYTDDERIWRFQIALDSTAHDGSLIKANDVMVSWEEALRVHRTSLFAWPLWCIQGATAFVEGTADGLTGLRTISALELEIELTQALPQFLEALARPSAWVACPRGSAWLGTGPFRMTQWQNDHAELQAFASYRWGRPYLDSIRAISYSDAERGRAAFDFQAGTLQMLWDVEAGEPVPVWVGLELGKSRFSQPAWAQAARNAVSVDSLLEFRQLTERGWMRFAGEPLVVHPAWQPYRPHKAYRALQQSRWDERQHCRLRFDSLPERSGPSIARLLEAQLTNVSIQTHVTVEQNETPTEIHLTSLSFDKKHLNRLQAIPEMPPFLLLYEDAWHVQFSERLRGWQLGAGFPAWDSLWLADE